MRLRAVRASSWLLGLLAAATLLRLAATGELASPPLTSVDDLATWVDARSPLAAGVALVRLLAEVAVWYLLALSALHATSHLLRAAGGHRLADALAVPGVRRAVRAGLGLGLVAASSVAGRDLGGDPRVTAAVAAPVEPGAATMRPVASTAGTATMRPLDVPTGTATMQPVELPTGTATMRPVDQAPSAATHSPVVGAPATWTVAVGESLWSIAEEVLVDAWGRAASDAEVEPYWRVLVAANRGRLVDPADPDLIHPGQVLEVPAVPVRPAV